MNAVIGRFDPVGLVRPTAARARIVRALDLASLDSFTAEMDLAPSPAGWRLSGRVRASLAQTCGITLEPLPLEIDAPFVLTLAEAVDEESGEIVITMDAAGDGSATFTLAQSGHDVFVPTNLVLDLSSYSTGAVITIHSRERKIYADGVLAMSIFKSGSWPLVPPAGDTVTYTFTNTTNVATIVTTWRETMLT